MLVWIDLRMSEDNTDATGCSYLQTRNIHQVHVIEIDQAGGLFNVTPQKSSFTYAYNNAYPWSLGQVPTSHASLVCLWHVGKDNLDALEVLLLYHYNQCRLTEMHFSRESGGCRERSTLTVMRKRNVRGVQHLRIANEMCLL
jgi:hypothetical protein